MISSRTSMFVLLGGLIACGPPHAQNGGGDDTTVDGGGGTPDGDQVFPQVDGGGGCTKIDLLFVIDNSGSMGDEQTNLIANFPTFINVLDQSGLDYRVAVTTTARKYTYNQATIPGGPTFPTSTSNGENGTMLQPASCNMTKRWIDKLDPNPGQTFACVANVGTSGSSDEMPLGAMRDAFEDRMMDNTNAGFHRSDALLGIVFLTDEEDCSYEATTTLSIGQFCEAQMEPPANYVSFLDTYTGHRTRWAAAAIAGMGPGQCSSGFGSADEATRLKAFVQGAGAQARMSSICDGDLSVSLTQTLALFQSACGGVIF